MEKLDKENVCWTEYLESNSIEDRNKLFIFYSNWVKKIATAQYSRLGSNNLEWEDAVQIASVALIECIERFDPNVGVPFEGFAVTRIKGAILNNLTKNKRFIERSWTFDQMECDEDSDEFDYFVDGVLDAAFSSFLDLVSKKSDILLGDPLYGCIEQREEAYIKEAINGLPENLRFVIESYYYNYLTFTQIADLLNISKARVSQMHHKALRMLRFNFDNIS